LPSPFVFCCDSPDILWLADLDLSNTCQTLQKLLLQIGQKIENMPETQIGAGKFRFLLQILRKNSNPFEEQYFQSKSSSTR